ncbi:MAG TPA: signal recognition particle-docking protein FtsY [Aggregatilineales bacterium]|nr:signal recognition particle-docking protein FtsY [Aggregatilineales bacterium]
MFESLRRTRQTFFGRIANMLGATELDEDTWDDIEALLIQADLGIETATKVTETLRKRVEQEGMTTRAQLEGALKETLLSLLPEPGPLALETPRLVTVVLVVGVNGSGKTTTIGKLAHRWKNEGWKVMLAAADTFRAAAVEQLQRWGQRVDVPVIAGQMGGDAGAVTYDAIRATRARGRNLLIVDTAGRLHTKYNLMEELKKVYNVAAKNVHEAPHEVLLVVDGTTGQNALQQAKYFKEAVNVTGVVVTKLDSTARGGMIFAIGNELGLPVRFVGIGEGVEDLIPFDPKAFVDGLFEQN